MLTYPHTPNSKVVYLESLVIVPTLEFGKYVRGTEISITQKGARINLFSENMLFPELAERERIYHPLLSSFQ